MKVISSLQSISQRLAVRLYTRDSLFINRQRGASALEYIVLAAAIIIIVGILAASDAGDTLVTAFEGLFTKASGVSGPGTDG